MNTEIISDSTVMQGGIALTNGHEYIVLEISARFKKAPSFRIEFTESGVRQSALFESRAFTVTSRTLSPTWKYFQLESGSLSVCPESWNAPGFWEAYYDGDPRAIAVYEAERAAILSHS
ncbi:hypothetical protein ACFUIV_24165 [Streptomyces anulatus]|uniref:hypothetical protein n=1 Tax=Streptomyces anulatus TaxID=1892 RepID=UPI003633D728